MVVAAAMAVLFLVALFASEARLQAATGADDHAALYKTKCAMCHGPDGSGETPTGKAMKVRDLRSADVQAQTDDQLYEVIAKGKGKMPGYEKSLGAENCKGLVAFVRSLKK